MIAEIRKLKVNKMFLKFLKIFTAYCLALQTCFKNVHHHKCQRKLFSYLKMCIDKNQLYKKEILKSYQPIHLH